MPVVVDAMGGDFAPQEIVKGAVAAATEFNLEVILVGDKGKIAECCIDTSSVTIQHASDVIGMNEHPAKAIRKKPDSSIAVAAKIAKETDGGSLVSAGHTGAVMAAAVFTFRRISGIERPAIACVMPSTGNDVIVLDVGANVDCKPSHLEHFGVMGAAYAKHVLEVENPRVGLLNIGEEAKKGNEQTLLTHKLLSESTLINFTGNVEPSGVFSGSADVIVADGFAGNILLKSTEAISNVLQGIIKKEITALSLAPEQLQGFFKSMARFSTKNPQYAGAPLLGVDGTCFIAHGGANAATIKHCIALADRFQKSNALEFMKSNIDR